MARSTTSSNIDEFGRTKDPDFAHIESTVVQEVDAAEKYTTEIQEKDRTERWNRYYGRPFGNERKGRSKYMSRDIMETIEWILPTLLSTFISSDPKVTIDIEGQPPVVGQAIMQKIQEDLNDDDERSLFILFYQWFKDALVSDTAFVTPSWEAETEVEEMQFPRASLEQMQQITSSPSAALTAYTDNGDDTYSDVDVEITRQVKDQLAVDNIPHWDVIVSEKAKFMNDEYGKGFKSEVTIDYLERTNEKFRRTEGKDFFDNLDRLRFYVGKQSEKDSGEKSQYMDGEGESTTGVIPGVDSAKIKPDDIDPKEVVEVVQWYDRIDINGDGVLENVRCWLGAGQVLLRYEANPDDTVMMCSLSPIIDCYKMFGIAYSELILDIQNLKTMLMRRILDNFDFATLGRTYVKPGGRVPIKEMLEQIPGDVLTADFDNIHTEYPKPVDSRSLTFLEYCDSIKENRTGSTRYNQGTDAESLNKTAAGIEKIQQASQKRIDMIARLFAETGIRDLYKKCVILYRNNLSSPFTIKVNGTDVTISPQQLQGRIKCKSNLGIEAQVGVMESQKLMQVFGFLSQVNQMFPGIVAPQQIHNLVVEYVANMGKKQPEMYVATIEQFMQSVQQAQQQAQQIQQMEIQLKQSEEQRKWAEVQIKAKEADIDLQEVMANFKGRMATKQLDVEQQRRSDMLDFVADMAKIQSQPKVQPAGS